MEDLKSKLTHLTNAVGKEYHLKLELEWLEHFPASMVNKESNAFVHRAAEENNYTIKERKIPFKFGEDFGWFSKTYKTAMFGIGAGLSTPALHNADYDFPDEIIQTGFSMFKSIILNILQEK